MSVACLAFTEKGYALARRLACALGGTADRSGQPLSLQQWTQTHFASERALVYVGAAGIAVRAIAPYLHSKTTDPAVVVVDEGGQFVIPLLSGHLGGANDLARHVARLLHAQAVITTATDVNEVFAVDEWARCQHCAVLHPENIRQVSGALLAGRTVRIHTEVPVSGAVPVGVALAEEEPWDVYVGLAPQPESVLWLVPQTVMLGVGCRKGITDRALEKALASLDLPPQCIGAVASIDLKAREAGLLNFCRQHGWPLKIYSAAQLAQVKGNFTASAFVEKTTGVDNVCERAAVLASGGTLLRRKQAENGVTMAAALKPYQLDWRFRNVW